MLTCDRDAPPSPAMPEPPGILCPWQCCQHSSLGGHVARSRAVSYANTTGTTSSQDTGETPGRPRVARRLQHAYTRLLIMSTGSRMLPKILQFHYISGVSAVCPLGIKSPSPHKKREAGFGDELVCSSALTPQRLQQVSNNETKINSGNSASNWSLWGSGWFG